MGPVSDKAPDLLSHPCGMLWELEECGLTGSLEDGTGGGEQVTEGSCPSEK